MKTATAIKPFRRFLKAILTGLFWLVLVVLLIVAWHLKDPHLFAYRHYETATLLLLSGGGIVFGVRLMRGAGRMIGLGMLVMVIAITLYGEGTFQYRKDVVLNETTPGMQQLGEHLIIGYTTPDEIAPLVSKGLIGGVFITRRNSQGKSVEALRQEIAGLQVLRTMAGLPPLIVTTDQEGGIVSRLSPPLDQMPPLSSLVVNDASRSDMLTKAEIYGRAQGRGLAALGVTVNFSPVVDLKSDRPRSALDFHSLIDMRAISSDPLLTAEVAEAYARGLRSQGVRATFKHFPGLGRVTDDTHHFSAQLDTPVSTLTGDDWIPFRLPVAETDALLMLGHVVLTQVDDQNPVSFSKTVVQGIIRDSWQHIGVLVTDDLTMNAAYRHGLCDATVKSLNAGVDLLLIAYDYEKIYDALYCANRAYEQNLLDQEMLQLSHQRLEQLH